MTYQIRLPATRGLSPSLRASIPSCLRAFVPSCLPKPMSSLYSKKLSFRSITRWRETIYRI